MPHDMDFFVDLFVSPRPSPACKPLRVGLCLIYYQMLSLWFRVWQSGVLSGRPEEQEVPVVLGSRSGQWPRARVLDLESPK